MDKTNAGTSVLFVARQAIEVRVIPIDHVVDERVAKHRELQIFYRFRCRRSAVSLDPDFRKIRCAPRRQH